MVDCSYPGSRPRHYELDKMDSPFSLRVLSDGSYSVAQYNGTNIHVTVPESFNGHKITKIDDEAFMHNIVDVESVELPDSITEIGVNAFTNCKSVKTIRIPKNVKIIERRAFAASGINDIEVDSENPFYTSDFVSSNEILDAILEERQKEFVGEGKRWFDLVRCNRWKEVMEPINGMNDERKVLFPIHRDHINQNLNLKQNSSY